MRKLLARWWAQTKALRPLTDEDYVAYLVTLGIKVEKGRDRSWRCGGHCFRMQDAEATRFWIPDGIRCGDPLWAVIERCRRWQFNGNYAAWCIKCCRGFGAMTPEQMLRADSTPHDPIPTIQVQIQPRASGEGR